MQSIAECHSWLEAQGLTKRSAEFKNKIKKLKIQSKVILIGGTNGKGSTLACMQAILLAQGYRVGSFVSPHLYQLSERVLVNGVPLCEADFVEAFKNTQAEYADIPTGWFEFLFALGCHILMQEKLDYWLIEVGVGGLNCCTNFLTPDISVVATIDMDHQAILGNTLEAIARQKAGIFRPHKPAICGMANPPQSLLDFALQVESNLMIQNKNFSYSVAENEWEWHSDKTQYEHLPLPNIPLQNASTALAALQFCNVDAASIHTGLKNLQVPGRMQIIEEAPEVICDVAHNPQAVEYLQQHLCQHPVTGNTYAILGIKSNKDVQKCLEFIQPLIKEWFLVTLADSEQKTCPAEPYLRKANAVYQQTENALDALKKAKAKATENDRILIFGSFIIVGEVLHAYGRC